MTAVALNDLSHPDAQPVANEASYSPPRAKSQSLEPYGSRKRNSVPSEMIVTVAWMTKAGSDETLLLPSRKEEETVACENNARLGPSIRYRRPVGRT
jgi:hypothetical protein